MKPIIRIHSQRRRIIAGAIALVLAFPAAATNGYFAHGYGTQSKAMAGTGVALAFDSLAPATNPAALLDVEEGFDLGIGWFAPDRGYEITGAPTGACLSAQQCTFGIGTGSLRSDKNFFLIPHFGWSKKLDDDTAIGIAVFGNGGMNTRYVGGSATFGAPVGTVPPGAAVTLPGTFGNGTAGVDLMQLFIAPTYAHRLGNGLMFGISPILAAQNFEARGLANFAPFSSNPSALTDNGHDQSYGLGLKLGIQVPISDDLRFGASYQSKIHMGEFDDYAGLFEGHGDFDIPPSATVGIALDVDDSLTLAFDVQWMGYSDVDSVGNPLFPNFATARLGDDAGPGFGWEDMTVFKLGARWRSSDRAQWHFGYSRGDQPIPSSEVLFNVLAPGVIEQHFTIGYTGTTESGRRWTVAGMYAPSKSVRGVNPLDPAQTIELSMDQFEVEFSWHFGR